MTRAVVFVAALLAGAGACHDATDFSYDWNDRRALCSVPMDDLTGVTPKWELADEMMERASVQGDVALLHAHEPDITIATASIERILADADARHLAYATYDELVAGPPRGSLALAFDDTDIDGWYALEDLFAAHSARVTFFITRWSTIGDAQRAELEELAALGHDVEPHTVNHVHAPDYVSSHGLDAYITDEILPSIQEMSDAGYPPTSLAFPFGETTPEITAAVLQHIDRVRIGPGTCPN